MILAIDCGNSRIKWACCSPGQAAAPGPVAWIERGECAIGDVERLAGDLHFSDGISEILVSNVAGAELAARLGKALGGFRVAPRWIAAVAEAGGVRNGYAEPARLGADRWCALVGARALHAGDCLVVMAGTATTVDLLLADGRFRGGLILPGAQLMKRALAERTAGLELADGAFADAPDNTADAIESGCLLAQVGAIEVMFRRLPAGALCMLSGGAAGRIAERLNIPIRVVDNLVLEGMVRLSPG